MHYEDLSSLKDFYLLKYGVILPLQIMMQHLISWCLLINLIAN